MSSEAGISRKSSVSSTDNLEDTAYTPQEMIKIFVDAFNVWRKRIFNFEYNKSYLL